MKRAVSLVLSTFILSAALGGTVYAQQAQNEAQQQKQPNEGANHGQDNRESTQPPNTGAADSGVSGSATTSGAAAGAPPAQSSSPAGQPLTATGEDLKGPPKQFAPNKTPE